MAGTDNINDQILISICLSIIFRNKSIRLIIVTYTLFISTTLKFQLQPNQLPDCRGVRLVSSLIK